MPLPVVPDAMKVTLRANLTQANVPVEQAQFGFTGVRVHGLGNQTNWPSDVQDIAEKVRDRWNEHITSKGLWSLAVGMDSVRVDHYNASTGRVQDSGFAPFTGDDGWNGTATASLPWETTLAVSLYGYDLGEFVTNKPRKRGRMYLPPMATTVVSNSTGQFDTSGLATLHTQLLAFFNDVQGMEFPGSDPGEDADFFDLRVLSKGTPLKPLDPTSTPIKRITLDSRIDSQRRRERQQPPNSSVSGAIARS